MVRRTASSKWRTTVLAGALAATVAVSLAALAPPSARGAYPAPIDGAKGAVAADSTVASEVGATILRAGGTAVDAAVATALALGVVHPMSSGLGGGGFAVVWIAAEKRAVAIDFRETAPAGASRDMFIVGGEAKPELSASGGLSVAVPGEVAGLVELHKRFGKLPWAKVVEPAARLASGGFVVDGGLVEALTLRKADIVKAPELAKLYYKADGTPVAVGEKVKNPALGATLAKIAKGGRDAFYKGPIAVEMVKAVKAAGGILTEGDLAAYVAKERAPLKGAYRGADVYAMPTPSSGGIVLLETLALLEKKDVKALGFGSSKFWHAVVEPMKHAFADRATHLGDADFVEVPTATLLSAGYAEALAKRIDARAHPPDWYGGTAAGLLAAPVKPTDGPKDGGTAHLSVVDAAGNVVALTTTVNLTFGARVVAGKTGIVMNDEMDDFAIRPGVPNAFGLIQSEKNAIAPGKRPLSSMCPLVVVRDGAPVWTAGGAGGPTIISGTLLATIAHLDFGKDPMAAVSAPRAHHQWRPDVLFMDPDVPADVVEALKGMGHIVKFEAIRNVLQAIAIDPASGLRRAAADPRRKHAMPAAY